jgi:hypothetical protein
MKESMRIFLLKLLAVTGVSLFIYPLVLVVRTAVFKHDGGVLAAMFYLLLILSGFFMGAFTISKNISIFDRISEITIVKFLLFKYEKTEKDRIIFTTAAYATSLFPVLTVILIFHSYGVARVLFEVIFAFLPYFIALRGTFNDFTNVFPNNIAYFGFILIAVSIEVSYFYRPVAYLKPYLYTIAYLYIFVYLILKNQEDIDTNIYVKKHIEKSILPKNMRSFNTWSVIVMFFVVLLLFNLKPLVMILLNMAGKVIAYFIAAVLWVLRHLNLGSGGGQPQQSPPQLNSGFFGTDWEINPLGNFINNIIKYFALIYFLYHSVLIVLRRIPSLFSRLAALLRRIFSLNKTANTSGIQDYDDETETIKPQKDRDKYREIRNRIRIAKKELKYISDPVERIRYIYGSVLGMLHIFGINIEKSDTTSEIYIKSKQIYGIDKPLSMLTGIYNAVRYGSSIPDKAVLTETDEYYSSAVELLKHN